MINSLFPRAMSQADENHPFDECRESQIPRSFVALQGCYPISLLWGFGLPSMVKLLFDDYINKVYS